ncbi:MAG TPA: FecR domain-containing protein [Parasegetibacter sp.]
MNYENFELEDFIMDESFQAYCIGNDPEAEAFWKQWLIAHPEKAELLNLAKNFYLNLNGNLDARTFLNHQRAFNEAIQANDIPVSSPFTGGQAMVKQMHTGIRWAGIAAAAILGVVLLTFWLNSSKKNQENLAAKPTSVVEDTPSDISYTYLTKAGEKKSFQLPDGTNVYLNAGSSIKLIDGFNKSHREMHLVGEAYFDVVHNPQLPFIIHTIEMDVKVLGTAFNVRAYPDDDICETSLVRGSVEVLLKGMQPRTLILKPTEKVVVDKQLNKLQSSNVNTKRREETVRTNDFVISTLTHIPQDNSVVELSWIDNRLTFSDERFEDIARKLERWYDISIQFKSEEIKEYRFTGTFDKETIQRVLEAMQLSRSFHFLIENDKKIILEE